VPEATDPTAPIGELTDLLGRVRDGVEVSGLRRLSGGASRETWAFTATSPGHGPEELILRRDPPGRPGPPGSMAMEADAMRAAGRAGLPVPEVLVDDDGDTLGTAGLVMSLVAGETIPRRILRDDHFAAARPVLAEHCGRFLAGLHAIDPAQVPGLEDADPLALYRQSYEELDGASPTFERAFRWLDTTRPPSDGRVVVHGDFRLGNILVGPDGLGAVLDWELAHLGDPVEDLSWLCVKAWRFRSPLPVGGFGTVESLLSAYEAAGGTPVDRAHLHWWLVLNTLKWGVMCLGQAAAHLTGATRSVELAAIGRRVCEQEWDLLELLDPDATATALGQSVADPEPEPPAPGLHGRPTATELLEATREFLTDEVVGSTDGRVSFHARVAANVLAMVERQLVLGPAQEERHREGLRRLGAGSDADLARAISAGDHDARTAEVDAVLAAAVHDKLTVANPRHLTL
jgi:aminoglycoside phosphotransferase (APT) family kinase protein